MYTHNGPYKSTALPQRRLGVHILNTTIQYSVGVFSNIFLSCVGGKLKLNLLNENNFLPTKVCKVRPPYLALVASPMLMHKYIPYCITQRPTIVKKIKEYALQTIYIHITTDKYKLFIHIPTRDYTKTTMYSSSSSSDSSEDSYDRRRHRCSRRSKQSNDNKPRSYKKKRSSSSRKVSSRSEQIKREHDDELRSVLQYLQNESPLLNHSEDKKREALSKLKHQHKYEVKNMFKFLETKLTAVSEKHAKKQANLEDKLEKTKDHCIVLEEELLSTTHESIQEIKVLNKDLASSLNNTSSLEEEVQALRRQLTEKDKCISAKDKELTEKDKCISAKDKVIRQLEVKDDLVESLRDDCRRKDDELQRKDRIIIQKNEEIRSITSKPTSSKAASSSNEESIKIISWEEESQLTLSSADFENNNRKKSLERMMYHEHRKPSTNGYSPGIESRTGNSSLYSSSVSKQRRETRDDSDSRRQLSVSFSDEIDKRMLPLQTKHENLSRRLEKMYLNTR